MGFAHLIQRVSPGYWENKFLSQVDISKGKIKVKVNTMIRQVAPDWSTDREDRKEYLTFNSDWMAKNYLGVDIRVLGHVEGVFMDQQRELVTTKDQRTGEETAYYRKGQARETFYIPFTKKKVEEILSDHPFGEDSINITNKDRVLYYGKFRYARRHLERISLIMKSLLIGVSNKCLIMRVRQKVLLQMK